MPCGPLLKGRVLHSLNKFSNVVVAKNRKNGCGANNARHSGVGNSGELPPRDRAFGILSDVRTARELSMWL